MTALDYYDDIYRDLYSSQPSTPVVPRKGTWLPTVRLADLSLADPILFTRLELVENLNSPDTLALDGDIADLRPALALDGGIVVHDDTGTLRFSGVPTDLTRRGDRTVTVVFTGDLVRLWDRICWPTPASTWSAQTTPYDIQTATAETRLLGYIARNAGSAAFHSGTNDRRIPNLRIPTSLNRGPSAKTSARFQNLGQLAADLAETADLRVEIRQTYEGFTPYLDVVLTVLEDLSAWAQFGPADGGGPAMLGTEWSYQLTAPATSILSAAGGELENRRLDAVHYTDRQDVWGRRVEFFLDQRGTTDAGEISEGITTAAAENAGTIEVVAPLASSDLTLGVDVPVGALVSVILDGEVVTDRIRQIITVVSGDSETDATVTVTPIFGTADAIKTPTQKQLAAALKRLRTLERTV